MSRNNESMGETMFNEKIKELRESRNLNQMEVAQGIGVSKNTYLKYEKNEQSPLLSTVEKIADFYGISTIELISDHKPERDNQVCAKLKIIEQLNEKEKESLLLVIEALILKSQTERIRSSFKESEKTFVITDSDSNE